MAATYSLRSSKARADSSPDGVLETPGLTAAEPAKRKREDEQEAPFANKRLQLEPTISKHPVFWALDGNLRLRFATTEFKLHRSRIATQSVLLSKLFETHAGGHVDMDDWEREAIAKITIEAAEGNEPEIYIMDAFGTAEDFAELLSAMDEGISFAHRQPPFPKILAIYRAARYLDFRRFEDYAAEVINDLFSDKLENLTSSPAPNPIDAILLAREWNIPHILKRAFYELLRAPTVADFEELDPDSESPDTTLVQDKLVESTGLGRLGTDDLVRLVDVQKRLSAAWTSALWNVSLDCTVVGVPCSQGHSGARRMWWQIVDDVVVQPAAQRDGRHKDALDVFLGFDKLVDAMGSSGPDASRKKFCQGCIKKRRALFEDKKKKLWEGMDEWLKIN
ncbi:hypothetical protein MKEN_00335700 [Mycena kentingensis (nom. inval.)]|nr:hypothetical protein MKEN_00335700 [Mycena kentingensis (nom. inval.)]